LVGAAAAPRDLGGLIAGEPDTREPPSGGIFFGASLLTKQPIPNPFLRKAAEVSRHDFFARSPAEAS